MTTASDFTKPSKEIVVDLINADNSTSYTAGDLSFGYPQPITDPQRNTEIQLTPTAQAHRVGWVKVRYNRIDLAEVPGTRSVTFFVATSYTHAHDLVARINSRYHIRLSSVDFVDLPLPAFDEQADFTLTAGADSPVFIGDVTLDLHRAIQIVSQFTDAHIGALSAFASSPSVTIVDKLVELLNAAIPNAFYDFSVENIAFSNPTTDVVSDADTRATVTALPEFEYLGTAAVHYYRVDLSQISTYMGFSQEAPFTAQQVVDAFNTAIGSYLKITDLQTLTIPAMDTGVVTNFALPAVPASLGWIGSKQVQLVTGIPASSDDFDHGLNVTWPSYF